MVNSRAALGHDKRRKWTSRLVRALVATSVLAATALYGIASPAAAGGATQISGTANFADDDDCGDPPPGFADFDDFTLVLSGDLEGCWYTSIDSSKDNGAPSGVYQERGREVFVGTINGGEVGTFATEYHFTSKWDPDVGTGLEVHGRCQHPIVEGLGNFTGLSGRLDFKDDVDFVPPEPPYHYRGHVKGL